MQLAAAGPLLAGQRHLVGYFAWCSMAEPTQIAQPRCGPDRQIIVPCDCVGACECLFVAEWDDGEGNEHWQSFEFYSSYRVDHWRQRLKSAWLALRGKQPFYHDIVTTPEQGRELGKWLLAKTADRDGGE